MDNDIDMIDVECVSTNGKDKKKRSVSSSSGQLNLNQIDYERKVIKAKRRILKPKPNKPLLIVLDTNIIIKHLNDIKFFLSTLDTNDNLTFVIPLIVIQELDCLKTKLIKNKAAITKAFLFINEHLKVKKWVTSDVSLLEKVAEDVNMEHRVDMIQMNNDDRILRRSLILKESFVKNLVIILTDDLNLRNKALALNLSSMKWSEFTHSYKFGLPLTNATDCEKLTKVNQETFSHSDWISVKYEAEQKLNIFIKKVLKEIYGSIWETIFKIDFKNCNLNDQIRVIKQGWVGTFSDFFERDNKWKTKIDTIFQLLHKENKVNDLKELINPLIQYINDKYPIQTSKRLKTE